MSIAAGLNRRITRLATGRHLPPRTVRLRLTFLYGALFLVSGAALMAIAYALLVNAGFVFTLQNGPSAATITQGPGLTPARSPAGLPGAGFTTRLSAQTMAHWRGIAGCMRQHGVSRFPDPMASVPPNLRYAGIELSDHDGAIFAIPNTINMQTPAFTQAAVRCGFYDSYEAELIAQNNEHRTQVRQQLLIQSGLALAGMSLLSLALGWLMAGRVLQPLEDSYEAQRQFVANASHELRAPLTRQRALIEVALADPQATAASLQAAHERVLAAEQHLEQMIDGLLTLTRGQAGLERRDDLDLADVSSQAMLARESQLEELHLDVAPTLARAPITGDPRLVERLIANLVDNSIRHNISGGRVEISTGTRDRRAFVSIANTGPIVPPEEIQRLFQPFQRLGAARTRHNSGHGLGLSIVKAIATAHQAEVTARSRPDGGLAIEVSFPPTTGVSRRFAVTYRWRRALRGAGW